MSAELDGELREICHAMQDCSVEEKRSPVRPLVAKPGSRAFLHNRENLPTSKAVLSALKALQDRITELEDEKESRETVSSESQRSLNQEFQEQQEFIRQLKQRHAIELSGKE